MIFLVSHILIPNMKSFTQWTQSASMLQTCCWREQTDVVNMETVWICFLVPRAEQVDRSSLPASENLLCLVEPLYVSSAGDSPALHIFCPLTFSSRADLLAHIIKMAGVTCCSAATCCTIKCDGWDTGT